MPRDGSGVYSVPYPDVVTLTTIESAKYNGTINDIEADLNIARPIVAGGTGATTAAGAPPAMGAAPATQVVTNYGTFAFANGFFQSANSAQGGPPTGGITSQPYYGFATVYDANSARLEAYGVSDGLSYARVKTGGVWGSWTTGTVGADSISNAALA